MIQKAVPQSSSKNRRANKGNRKPADEIEASAEPQRTSTLIEFPGTARSVPEWRKQLSQRVREVQERKAREAAEELAAAQAAGLVSCVLPSGQLELVPDLEQQAMNPIVSKALERIDRARRSEYLSSQMTATATAPAFAHEPALNEANDRDGTVIESKPRLTVVAPIESVAIDHLDQPVAGVVAPDAVEQKFEFEPQPLKNEEKRKSVRVLSDNDASLSYLETCLSLPPLSADTRHDIPTLTRRITAGVLDLFLVAVMVSPLAAAIEYSGGDWFNPRVFGLMGGITAFTIFSYFTISVALTGRTLAMRVFSLRAIDIRTGLIPTGGQAIIRALSYVFSLGLFGLGLAYVFIDADRRTIHDRFSNTIVVRG